MLHKSEASAIKDSYHFSVFFKKLKTSWIFLFKALSQRILLNFLYRMDTEKSKNIKHVCLVGDPRHEVCKVNCTDFQQEQTLYLGDS